VGPDNGLFTPFIEEARNTGQACTFISLDKPQYWLPNVSYTFHGRDIFAPAGAHLASGTHLEDMGTPFTDPKLISMPKPRKTDFGYITHVIVIDTFGNMTTDLPAAALAGKAMRVRVKGQEISELSASYGHKSVGSLVALVDSEGALEVAVVNGSAAKVLDMRIGDEVEVILS
jgi:S-adenosyl-L-methionine hydrolase (adenosine-forming)